MYIAMNRFKVAAGSEADFEAVWRNRDSSLSEVPGFSEFRLLQSEEDFLNWTKSESFRAAHRNAGDRKTMYLGPPVFEGFTVVDGI
jgi:heme-degrading monooxygenase HmoA